MIVFFKKIWVKIVDLFNQDLMPQQLALGIVITTLIFIFYICKILLFGFIDWITTVISIVMVLFFLLKGLLKFFVKPNQI